MSQHPEYLGVYCPTCKQDCLPIHGRCGFCDTRVVDPEPRAAPFPPTAAPADPLAKQVAEGRVHPDYLTPPAAKETTMPTCKIDGCESRPVDSRGPYAGLCPVHKSEKIEAVTAASKAARERQRAALPVSSTPEPAAVKPPPVNGNGHGALTLVQLAQAVEDAQAAHEQALQALRDALEAA